MSILRTDFLLPCLDWLDGLGDGRPREWLAAAGGALAERDIEPNALPVLRRLGESARLAESGAELAAALLRHAPRLRWGQTYAATDFGERFMENYGWVELVGTRGHFVHDRIAAGFLLLGPGIEYPDHHHVAEELYVPLTGGVGWRRGEGDFVERAGGEVIHHPSGISHAMRTGDTPLLAFYLWRGGPLDQKSTIGRQDG